MRRTLGIGIGIGIGRKLPDPSNISNAAKQTLIPFATSSGSGGGGRGRGRGISPPTGPIGFVQQKSDDSPPDSSDSTIPSGLGHGHGKPIPSPPVRPPFSSFDSPIQPPSTAAGRGRVLSDSPIQPPSAAAGRGRVLSDSPIQPPSPAAGRGRVLSDSPIQPPSAAAGRGRVLSDSPIQPPSPAAGRGQVLSQPSAAGPHPPQVQDTGPERPNFFKWEERLDTAPSKPNIGVSDSGESILPESVRASFGYGRGKPMKQPVPETDIKPEQENRHIRAQENRHIRAKRETGPKLPKMTREEAVKHAVRVLTQAGDGENDGVGSGRGMRGRGRGRWRDGGRWRGRGGRRNRDGDSEDGAGLYLGDNADGEKLANKLGPETMNKLVEAFEEMSDRVLPSPMDDAYLDALHTNLMIELEPEYLMGDFERNPDIDEKPPIPLRDALEKMKPFLMAYEGIQSHEEWEEIMKETMETVPLMKEIVDYYSGPDTVTSKEQEKELERVAKTVPPSAPYSVMRFTERAVRSLQSNPGWKFGQKCEFMDRLVGQVSQQYK